MTIKITTKKVIKTLRVSQIFNTDGTQIGNGILNTTDRAHNDMWVQILDEFSLKNDLDVIDPTHLQVHIGGTRKAFEELATVLLALARLKTITPDFSINFDWEAIKSNGTTHFIIHAPVTEVDQKAAYPKVHTVAKAIISKDDKILTDTTVRKKHKNRNKS